MSVTFYLNKTTLTQFQLWLMHWWGKRRVYGDDTIQTPYPGRRFSISHFGPKRGGFAFTGHIITPDEDGNEIATGPFEFIGLIALEIGERLQVTGDCESPQGIFDFYTRLLVDISMAWPDSQMAIHGYLKGAGFDNFSEWALGDFISPKLAKENGPTASVANESQQTKSGYENVVLVSYAWGGESERTVDEIERAFTERGIRIIRDKKDLGYKGSIQEFEQRIGRGQCIVLVISDKYLRSEHCMYELVEVDENRNLRERIFPIVLADARIYKAIDRLTYIKHWEEQIEQLNQAIKQVGVMTNLAGITADLDKYARIRANFDHLTDLLRDMNALTPEIHESSGFSRLISAVERTLTGE